MKDNKQFWTTVITAVVLSVVVSIIILKLGGSVLLSPKSVGAVQFVNANACNADGVCEVNNINASGKIDSRDLIRTSAAIYASAIYVPRTIDLESGDRGIVFW